MTKRADVERKWCNNCSKQTIFSFGLCLGCLSRINATHKGELVDEVFIQKIRESHPEVNEEEE